MNTNLEQQLQHWYQQWQHEDLQQSDRLQRWRNIEPESAHLLALWARSKQARKILELGTSNGYSTLWLADALVSTGGMMDSVEIDASRSALAAQHLQQVGLDASVRLHVADAGVFLAQAAPEYDLILLDAERKHYVSYWQDLRRLLVEHAGAVLIVDNVLSHASQVMDFIHLVKTDANISSHTIRSGAGLLCVTAR